MNLEQMYSPHIQYRIVIKLIEKVLANQCLCIDKPGLEDISEGNMIKLQHLSVNAKVIRASKEIILYLNMIKLSGFQQLLHNWQIVFFQYESSKI